MGGLIIPVPALEVHNHLHVLYHSFTHIPAYVWRHQRPNFLRFRVNLCLSRRAVLEQLSLHEREDPDVSIVGVRHLASLQPPHVLTPNFVEPLLDIFRAMTWGLVEQ